MIDDMRQAAKRADARQLVWLLSLVGIVAGAIVFGVTAPAMTYIQYHYETSAAQRNKIDEAIAKIQQSLTDGRRDFAEVILAPGSFEETADEFADSLEPHWYAELEQAVSNIRQDPNFADSMDVQRLAKQMEEIPETYLATVAWSQGVANAEAEKAAAQHETQATLHRIRAYFAEVEGRRRLNLALQLRQHLPDETGVAVAHDDLVESFRVAAEYEAIVNELMQLAILCERLTAERDVDQLVNLKDNELNSTFSRLDHALQRISGDRDSAIRQAAALQIALLGEGFAFDEAHQTIHPGAGGLYVWQREELLGKGEQAKMLRFMEEKFDAFQPLLASLESHFSAIDAREQRHADQAGAAAWAIMIITGIVCICVFLFLARRIAGIITLQIEVVERKSSELEVKNGEVRLLQDVAEAANKTATLTETVEFVMERFAEHSRYTLALATFTDERGHRQVVATDAWKNAGLPLEPIVGSCGSDLSARLSVRPLDFENRQSLAQLGGLQGGLAIMMRQETFFVNCHFFSTEKGRPERPLLRLAEQVAHRLSQTLERAQANSRLQELNSRLIDSARHAGMAEVATGVLHNVGNALNSVNTSLSFLRDCTAQSSYVDLKRTLDFVVKQSGSLEEFMVSHPKRTLIFPMLSELDERLRNEHEKQLAEVEDVRRHVDHIKKIVAVQQSLARVQCVLEPTDLPDILQKAIDWQGEGLRHHQVEVDTEFLELPLLKLDKHRVLEIFGNLVKNAMESIVEAKGPQRRISVCLRRPATNKVAIEVRDTGLGIKPENLNSIFSYGFTTKSNGHGFGLHSASLSAKQMGGKLEIESDGVGKGAMFRLTLPYVPVAEESLV